MPNYTPYTPLYQPYPIYQQPIIQPQYQQIQQQPQQNQQQVNSSSIIWVRNQNEAAMFPLAPNNAVALWDSSCPAIYLKQADASGKPSMKVFDLIERTETPVDGAETKADKSISYATKDELGVVVGAVKDFDKAIGALKSEIDNMKGDLYGIAGKKKTAKKVEDEE